MRILILATAIVLGLAGTAAASGPDGALLVRLMAAGDHDGARAHLAATLSAPTLHALHRTHLEGLIARQQGRHADAVSLFRAALVIDPGFVPARIELARTLLALRNFEGARYQFEILALNGDATIGAMAQSGLDQIRANRGYGGEVRFSLAPSSNLNRGSAHDTFAAGGLAFAIDPDSRQTAGTGMTIGASAYNSFTLGKEQSLVASAGADLTTDIERSRAEQLSLRAGLSWQGRLGGSRFALGPVVDATYLASQPHLWRSGLSGRLEVPVGTQNLVALSFTALTQDYASQSYRNGIRVLAAGAITHALTPAMRARFQVGMDVERTQLAHLDHDGAHAELRLANEWPGGFSTSAFASYARVQHRGDFPGTASPRADDRLTAGVTASNSQIDLGGFTPELTYSYTRQFSTVSFFDYDSHDISLGLTNAF